MDEIRIKFSKLFKFFIVIALFSVSIIQSTVAYAGYSSYSQMVSAGIEDRLVKIANGLIKQGFSYESAIGVMTNMNTESNYEPTVWELGEGNTSGGYGLIQWTGPRNVDLHKYLDQHYKSDYGSIEGQMAYLNEEVKTSQSGAMAKQVLESQLAAYGITVKTVVDGWDEYKKMTDYESAAMLFMVTMERPSQNPNTNHWEQRKALSKELYEGLKGKVDKSGSSDSSDSKDVTASDASSEEGVPDEDKLVGMSERNYLYDTQLAIAFTDGSDLTIAQKNNIVSLKEDSKLISNFDYIDFIRTLISFIGIWIAVYAIALFVAYMFDRNNIYLSVSLVSILTRGTIVVNSTDDQTQRNVNFKEIIKRIILMLGLSIILISGAVYGGISLIIYWIQRLLGL